MKQSKTIIKRYPENIFGMAFSLIGLLLLTTILVYTPFNYVEKYMHDTLAATHPIIMKLIGLLASNSLTFAILIAMCLVIIVMKRFRLAAKLIAAMLLGYALRIGLLYVINHLKYSVLSLPGSFTAFDMVDLYATLLSCIYFVVQPYTHGSIKRYLTIGFLTLLALRFAGVSFSVMGTSFGLLIGWFTSAAVFLLLGFETKKSTPNQILKSLQKMGYKAEWIQEINTDARGSEPFIVHTSDGSSIFVKEISKEHLEADLLFKMWRKLFYRSVKDELLYSNVQQKVEHEGFVAMLAKKFGINTPDVLAAVHDESGNGFLIYEYVEGTSLDGLKRGDLDDAALRSIFDQVSKLHQAKIAHKDLRLANLYRKKNGEIMIMDFGFSVVYASNDAIAKDLVELTVSLCKFFDIEQTVSLMNDLYSKEIMRSVLQQLQPMSLSSTSREYVRKHQGVLEEIGRSVMAQVS